jgi:hypothetical protein
LWYFNQSVIPASWFTLQPQQLRLAVTNRNRVLHITWNHAAKDLDHASGGMLIIRSNAVVREINLDSDELRLGSVECEVNSSHVELTLAVHTPGSVPISQSVMWRQ